MPSSSSYSTKKYAPLADEVNPPFGNTAPAPSVSRNGTIVYSKRISSPTSNNSSEDENNRSSGRSDSDDTLTGRRRRGDRKGKGRAHVVDEEYGDIGSRSAHHHTNDSWEEGGGYIRANDEADSASYPPLNETEEEEKRIQANLAKFAARDQARRKAARLSKTFSASPSGSRRNSITSSTSSQSRSQMSPLSSISESKRGSIFGYVGSLVGSKDKLEEENEVPLSPVSAQTQSYTNPYEPQPSASSGPLSPTAPSMTGSSPFADPASMNSTRREASSSTFDSSVDSPIDGAGNFGYAGPGWRGGATQVDPNPPRREKWWHALCAWGADLDGGDSKQAGRTNPME